MTIYLYVKTHNKTGLKYLGKTTSKNPHKYKGSGADWKTHLKEYGADYTTEIIKECQTNEELNQWGRYYSKLWNVVESIDWANRIPETGGGVGMSPELASKYALERVANGTHNLLGDKNPVHKLVANGTHNLLGDKNPVHKLVANGTHHLLGGEIQKASNRARVNDGSHHLLGPSQNLKRVANGTHPGQILVTCPHCGKTGGKPGMVTSHFDKCKQKPN
jgi:hypothetical protein